jgi:hypothetical protein
MRLFDGGFVFSVRGVDGDGDVSAAVTVLGMS